MDYYVQIFDKGFGPLTKERILQLLDRKKINHSTMISNDAANWQTLDSFPELAGSVNYSVEYSSNESSPSVPASTLWNYSLDGVESVGPIPFEELAELVRTGFLHGDTIVWKEGDNESSMLRDVPEFRGGFSSGEKPSKNIISRLFGR